MSKKTDYVKAKVHTKVTPGESVKIMRELQGFSQAELAELTGITQSNISAIENDRCQLGRDRATTLAKALRVHPAVLLFPDYDMDHAA